MTMTVVVIPQQVSNFFSPKSILAFSMPMKSKGLQTHLMQILGTIHAQAIPYGRSVVGVVDSNFDSCECR
jgi:hypothetical protein